MLLAYALVPGKSLSAVQFFRRYLSVCLALSPWGISMKLTTSTELVGNASYAANVFEAAALRTPATKRRVRIRSEA
jgi:hypothetical protein